MTARLLDSLRTVVTLAVLVVLLLIGLVWGWSKVTDPVPSLSSTSDKGCVDRTVAKGDALTPSGVTVSVLNAGNREGLAGRTMEDLTQDGFDRGQLANAPGDTKVKDVEIWTTDRGNPAVKLLRGYLGKGVTVKDADTGADGVSVLVGDEFTGVVPGPKSVKARSDSSVCGP